VGLERLEQAGRGETIFVVSAEPAPAALLERVNDARRNATVLALDQGDPELDQLAHEVLTVAPGTAPVSFDAAQHLVSSAAGRPDDPSRRGLRQWLNRVLDTVSGPAPQ
jgi:DNA-binding MurR/RpiR family transcriptional regulator